MRRERQHIIDAMATYICAVAKKENMITSSVNTEKLREKIGASFAEQEKAYNRARMILRDFM